MFNFFKKRTASTMTEKEGWTIHDEKLQKLRDEVENAFRSLSDQAQSVLVKKEAISIYPEGVDKDEAISSFNEAQQVLLAKIAYYDSARNNFNNYLSKLSKEDYHNDWFAIERTSHETIEVAIYLFYKS